VSKARIYGTSALHVLSSREPSAGLAVGQVELSIGGPAAVVACQLALLGHQPQFVGTIGADSAGDYILAELIRHGVDASALISCPRTPRVLALLGRGPVRLAADIPSGDVLPPPERWLDAPGVSPGLPGWRPSEPGYATGFPEMAPVIKALGDRGQRLAVDVGYIPLLSDVPALIEHIRAFAHAIGVGVISGQSLSVTDRTRVAGVIMDGGAVAVLTTLGASGVIVRTADGAEHLPAIPVPAEVDSLCAGDTFTAGFLSGLMEGRDMLAAAQFGQAVAAAKVSLFGRLPSRDQVAAVLAAREGFA
jgi:sugar/nucleoside kinase (ribokinase family)